MNVIPTEVPCKGCGETIITTLCYDCMSQTQVKLLKMIDAVKEMPALLTDDEESRKALEAAIDAALERGSSR